jgi:hypothetical protein
MSLQSAVQHTSLAAAAVLSSRVLTENADKSLNGIPTLGLIAVGFAVLLPTFITLAERALKRRDAALRKPEPPAAVPATPPLHAVAGVDS